MKTFLFFCTLILGFCCSIFSQSNTEYDFPLLTGPYLGQNPPGMNPEIFAPGIISDGLSNRDVTMTPDGKEMYFGVHSPSFQFAAILVTRQENNRWTKPEVVSFATDPRYVYLEPFINYDGSKMYFLSNMPKDSTENPGDEDIWIVDRIGNNWGKPYNLGEPVNSDGKEFYPSLTKDGTIYFTRAVKGEQAEYTYRSRFVNEKYSVPEKLPEQVNCGVARFNAYISPDEDYLVIPAIGVEEGVRGVNYYIVFRNEDDTWQEPKNIELLNSVESAGWSFYVSPDKKYAFFMARNELPDEKYPEQLTMEFFLKLSRIPENGNPDIYWIDAGIIEKLKP